MAMTGVEVVWDDFSYDTRDRVEPLVNSAVDLAGEGLDYLGILSDKTKELHVLDSQDGYLGGSASDDVKFNVYLPDNHAHIKIKFPLITLITVHEYAHSKRFEHEPNQWSRLLIKNLVATEGIAMWGEYTIAQELLSPRERCWEYPNNIVGKYFQPQPAKAKQLFEQLETDTLVAGQIIDESPDLAVASKILKKQLRDKWTTSKLPKEEVSDVCILGQQAVGGMLRQGASLVDIMAMPAEQIINDGIAYDQAAT